MFANAYQKCTRFTFPVIISIKYFDNTTDTSIGTFIVTNNSWHILTAAHLLATAIQAETDQKEIIKYQNKIKKIENDFSGSPKWMKKRIEALEYNPKWIMSHSYLWSIHDFQINSFHMIWENDLACWKIENYKSSLISEYPIFKDGSKWIVPWTSLCRLWFPFVNGIETEFDKKTQSFNITSYWSGITFFPNEWIFTRNVGAWKTSDWKDVLFLETSSPWLRWQSGWPIFDKEWAIWWIQSQTSHLPLGFSPKIIKSNKEIEEHQFLNVWWGVHPAVINHLLKERKIPFLKTSY